MNPGWLFSNGELPSEEKAQQHPLLILPSQSQSPRAASVTLDQGPKMAGSSIATS